MQTEWNLQKNNKVIEGNDIFYYYNITQQIGYGNSSVYEAINKTTFCKAAIKEVVVNSDIEYQLIKNEIQLLQKIKDLKIPGMIQFIDYCITFEQDEYSTIKTVYILMETGVTGVDRLVEKRKSQQQLFSEDMILHFLNQTSEALCELQKNNITHCDIKPENIIIMDIDKLDCKICDVGSGQLIESTHTKSVKGTVPFLAPELIFNIQNPSKQVKYNPYKCDVFSLGLCLLYVSVFKKFQSIDRIQLIDELQKEIIDDLVKELKTQVKSVYFQNGNKIVFVYLNVIRDIIFNIIQQVYMYQILSNYTN